MLDVDNYRIFTDKLKDFLLDFKRQKPKVVSKEQVTNNSKNYWSCLAGIKLKDKK